MTFSSLSSPSPRSSRIHLVRVHFFYFLFGHDSRLYEHFRVRVYSDKPVALNVLMDKSRFKPATMSIHGRKTDGREDRRGMQLL